MNWLFLNACSPGGVVGHPKTPDGTKKNPKSPLKSPDGAEKTPESPSKSPSKKWKMSLYKHQTGRDPLEDVVGLTAMYV